MEKIDGRKRNLDKRFNNYLMKFKEKHGDKYDYSKVIYLNKRTKIKIICPIHGPFYQLPGNHVNRGCLLCGHISKGHNNTIRYEEFLKKSIESHDIKYEYIIDSYKGAKYKVDIICPIHGEFKQLAFHHMNGANCIECDRRRRDKNQTLTQDEAINKLISIHGKKYDYSKVKYINYKSKIVIICQEHGEYTKTYSQHSIGRGCSKCDMSLGERKIFKYLNDNNTNFISEKTFPDCKNINVLSFDFYIPSLNTCIEFDGIQHFESIEYFGGNDRFNYMKKCDEIKNNYCINNKIKLIRIPYYEIENIEDILNKELNILERN